MTTQTQTERMLMVSSDGHVGPPVEAYRSYVDPDCRADFDGWLEQYVPMWVATRAKESNLTETLSESYKREWLANAKVADGARLSSARPWRQGARRPGLFTSGRQGYNGTIREKRKT